MTIPSTDRKAGPLTGNGVNTAFPFAFKVFAAGDVRVTVADGQGVERVLTINTDYTVTLNPNQETSPGGTVNHLLPSGHRLTVTGDIDYDQPLDLPSGGNFNPTAIENQLDRSTMQIQQLAEQMGRAVKVPVTEQGDGELSTALARGILRLMDSADNVDTVADNITNVNAVAENVADVNTVASNMGNVAATGANIAAVVTVANDLNEPVSEIDTVATNITNVNTVGQSIGTVNTVASNIADVNTVAANIADVQTVADNVADVTNFADVYYGPRASDPATRSDGSPSQLGDMYFNTGTKRARVFDGTAWVEGSTASGTYTVDTFMGDGAETTFALSVDPVSKNNTQIFIDGVYQQKSQYDIAGGLITFTTAPPAGTYVEAATLTVVSLGTVDSAFVPFANTTVKDALGKAVLSYPDYAAASAAAATLPDGQVIETEDTEGRLSRYEVLGGVMVFKSHLDQLREDLKSEVIGAKMVALAVYGIGTIADLRSQGAPERPTTVVVNGYFTDADGGGGVYVWDNSSTKADDAGVVIVPTGHSGAGRWVRQTSLLTGMVYGGLNDKFGGSNTIAGDRAGILLKGSGAGLTKNYATIYGFRAAEQLESTAEDTFVGTFAGSAVTESTYCTAVGYGAMRGMETSPGSGTFRPMTATSSTAFGAGALQNGVSHGNATAFGALAGRELESTSNVTLFGQAVAAVSKDLSRFSAFGAASAYNWGTTGAATDSEYTVVFGDIAGFNVTQGKESVLIGGQAGINSTRSDRNVFIGFQTGPYSTAQSSVSDSVCVGHKAQTLASNTIAIGNDISVDTPGRMQLGGLQTTSALIRGVYDSTSAAAANVVIDQYGMLYRSSSSAQYKKDIEDLQDASAENILRMRPVWYRSKCDADKEDWSWFGLIAEEVAEIEPRLVSWRTHEAIKTVKNIDGKDVVVEVLKELDAPIAEGVHYDRFVPLLLKMLQKQQQQIDELMRSRI